MQEIIYFLHEKIYPVKIYLCLLSFKSFPKIIYFIEFWNSAQLKNHYGAFFSIFIKQGNIKQQFNIFTVHLACLHFFLFIDL